MADGSGGAAAPGAPLAEAEGCVGEMEDLEDYYFGADKEGRLSELAAAVEASVERAFASPDGARQELRPRALFLRGRAASLLPGRERAAEELLSKAIKLDPQLLGAWNALGEVYWNLRDAAQAKQCFEQALELCGTNVVSLRNLSMALRAMDGGGPELRSANFTSALAKAKEAVALDPLDPLSWETLGNAYVGDFFVNARRPDEISRALIAYGKAEAAYERKGKRNPTLDFNRGMAAKYVEDYQLALSSFSRAHDLGAQAAAAEGRRVLELVRRLAGLVERGHDLKAKRVRELTAELLAQGEDGRSLGELRAGERAEAPLAAAVVSVVDRKDEVPVILTCCDSAGAFFALSIYNAELRKVAEAVTPMRSVLRVPRAKFREVSVEDPSGRRWSYPSAMVSCPSEVVLPGGGTLAAAAVQSMVYSTGADRTTPGAVKPDVEVQQPHEKDMTFEDRVAECQRRLCRAAKEARATGGGKAAVIKALLPSLQSLIKAELGQDPSTRLSRVEAMFSRMAQKQVHTEDDEQNGRRYAPGFIEGLTPNMPFHDDKDLPWCVELKQHWGEIRDELHRRLDEAGVWVPGAYAASNKAYAPDWKISGVLVADKWDSERWSTTEAIIKRLKGVTPFEVFFARMPPHTSIAAHSDNLNYVLTSHLALDLEPGMCSICVGNWEREWEEGEMLVFDTTYIHSAWNDSGRDRYVLVLRFWHPGLTVEERRAIHLSHALLAGTPDPDTTSQGTAKSSMSMTDD